MAVNISYRAEEFNPESETDDEETISKAEVSEDGNEQSEEVEMLQKESELPIEDILKRLPPEILEKPASIHSAGSDHDVDGLDDVDVCQEKVSFNFLFFFLLVVFP